MAFCMNCGHEVPDDKKFCPECGSTMPEPKAGIGGSVNKKPMEIALPIIDRFGRIYGIVLLFLAFLNAVSEPPIRTIFVGTLLIAAEVFCLIRRYKWKGFTIAAIVITAISLLLSMSQAKKTGLFHSEKDLKAKQEAELESAPYVPYVAPPKVEAPDMKDDSAAKDESATKDESTKKEEAEKKDEAAKDADTSSETAAEAKDDASADSNTSADKNASSDNASEDEAVSENEAAEASEDKTDADGVDPDLKAFLDSYEEFMDEYCEFMKKYNSDPGNAISMMADYLKMLEKAEEYSLKADAYKGKEMSKADEKYYVDTMARIEKKLIDVY